ncbi:MAG: hypothetical protein K9N51_13460, partial [Candidatus Pacebacteria bacterium]|nr:hypothetical protein [Candidatus Paceibacterota bacterium]
MKSARFMTKASVVAVVLAALISTIVFVQNRMNEIRERRELVDTSIAENAPPVVAFTTVALGSFRGLVADALWLRSAKMKEEGNYFEMVQLASWIVKLQPRFTGAHAYLAWNMAYNVSVTFNDFEDRWRWVQRGIELLRDEALVYNPGDPTLFKELGWIYQHKLGQEMDDANRYYKVQLAKQMLAVLGRYPVVWERWAEAPVTHAALMTSLGPAAQDLKSILIEYDTTLDELQKTFRDAEGELDDPLAEVLAENGIWEQLELYFRARWMREGLKLDPGRIWRLNEKYGELDWRLPEAHAIYWATRGLEEASEGVDIACERMIFQGLAAAFRGGRLIFLKDAEALEITPNINVVDAVNERYLDT